MNKYINTVSGRPRRSRRLHTSRQRLTTGNGGATVASNMSLKRAELLSDDSSPESKRHAPGPSASVCLRALIEANQCARLIGPRGDSLRQMRKGADESGQLRAHITPDNGARWRVIQVTGSTLAVGKFYGLMVRRLLDEDEGPATSESRGYKLYLLVPNMLMGKLIGKNKCVMLKIEDESSAKLDADRATLPGSDDRLVHVYGVCDAIHIAVFHIGEIFASNRDVRAKREFVPESDLALPEVGLSAGRRDDRAERARMDEVGQRMDRNRAPGVPVAQGGQGGQGAQGAQDNSQGAHTPSQAQPAPPPPTASAAPSLSMPEGAPRALLTAFETAKQSRKPQLRQIIKTMTNIDKLVKDIAQVTETTLTVLDADEGTLQIEGPPDENELAIYLAFRHLRRSKEGSE